MIFRPARATDMEEICTLLATPKRDPEAVRALLMADPAFTPARIRIAWTGGHVVACAKIYPRTLRIGPLTIATGGIGNVRTDPRYWHQGLAGSLLGECLNTLALEGVTLSLLCAGRHDLFARWGWHAIPETVLEIPAHALAAGAADDGMGVGTVPPHEGAPAPLRTSVRTRVRPLAGPDLDAVIALHESANAARTGSALRSRDDWFGLLTVLDLQGAVLLVAERDERIEGYAVAHRHGERVEIVELLLAPRAEDMWLPLLRGVQAAAGAVARVRAVLPGDYHRLIQAALGPAVTGGARDDLMLRIVDPGRLLQRLSPLLTARLREAPSDDPLRLRIGPLRGGAVLRVDYASIVVERPYRGDDAYTLSESTFLALLLGAKDANARLDDSTTDGDTPLPDRARDTLARLFPPQDWVFWRSDAF